MPVGFDFIPLVLLPACAVAFGSGGPAWAWMWWIAFACFFACKALTLTEIQPGFPLWDHLAYFFLWPGMDTRAFYTRSVLGRSERGLGRAAFRNMLAGGLLLCAVPEFLHRGYEGPAALAGMAGLVFQLHFGLFHVLALLWQRAGRPVEALMDNPAAARSLAEFWGKRWNRGYNHLIRHYVFKPLVGRLNPAHALLFPPAFTHNIILPMLNAWGITQGVTS